MKKLAELIGWASAVLLICTYTLYARHMIPADGLWFNLLNALGALGIIVYAASVKAWPVLVLLLGWGALSVYALYVYL